MGARKNYEGLILGLTTGNSVAADDQDDGICESVVVFALWIFMSKVDMPGK